MRRWHIKCGVLLILLSSCGESETISLPDQQALTAGPSFAVALPLYTRVHSEPGEQSAVVTHLRSGELVRILGQTPFAERITGTLDHWFEIEAYGGSGWTFGGYLDRYETRSRAESVARPELLSRDEL